ncbi:MAG TPA: hypothetical protein PLO89_04725 [Spirochaetota bacterium]|nr:hypothetical protein [Spirochaetota bacterium]
MKRYFIFFIILIISSFNLVGNQISKEKILIFDFTCGENCDDKIFEDNLYDLTLSFELELKEVAGEDFEVINENKINIKESVKSLKESLDIGEKYDFNYIVYGRIDFFNNEFLMELFIYSIFNREIYLIKNTKASDFHLLKEKIKIMGKEITIEKDLLLKNNQSYKKNNQMINIDPKKALITFGFLYGCGMGCFTAAFIYTISNFAAKNDNYYQKIIIYTTLGSLAFLHTSFIAIPLYFSYTSYYKMINWIFFRNLGVLFIASGISIILPNGSIALGVSIGSFDWIGMMANFIFFTGGISILILGLIMFGVSKKITFNKKLQPNLIFAINKNEISLGLNIRF